MDEKKVVNPAEMSDEEFLEYLASLGSDEEDVIDEGAEDGDMETVEESEAEIVEDGAEPAPAAEDEEAVEEETVDETVVADETPAEAATDESGRIIDQWLKEEAELKKSVPNFSLQQAFGNPQFKKLVITDGLSIADAYAKMNPEKEAEPPALDEIGRSASGAGNGASEHDIDSMSDEEFNKYIKRIQEEE